MRLSNKKLFVVRKYIMAKDVKEALRLDKFSPVDDVWMDEDFKKNATSQLPSAIGFAHYDE
jgi:hypothetical protein